MNSNLVPIAVLVFVLSFALALGLFFLRLMRREKQRAIETQERLKEIEERVRRAYFAQAKILSVSRGETVGRGEVKVDLFLEVMSPGAESYQTSASWLVDLAALPQIQQGQIIQIKIDSKNAQLIYPSGDWARVQVWS